MSTIEYIDGFGGLDGSNDRVDRALLMASLDCGQIQSELAILPSNNTLDSFRAKICALIQRCQSPESRDQVVDIQTEVAQAWEYFHRLLVSYCDEMQAPFAESLTRVYPEDFCRMNNPRTCVQQLMSPNLGPIIFRPVINYTLQHGTSSHILLAGKKCSISQGHSPDSVRVLAPTFSTDIPTESFPPGGMLSYASEAQYDVAKYAFENFGPEH